VPRSDREQRSIDSWPAHISRTIRCQGNPASFQGRFSRQPDSRHAKGEQ